MFDVIAVGDTTQDIFLKMHDASLQCDIDGKNCKICFDFADKIAVEQKTDLAAVGNAPNHAIGVARLGLRSALYTVVGHDDQGRKAIEVLESNSVDTRYIVIDEKRGTNLSVVINYQGERTILVYHEPREYRLPDLTETRWVYLTSSSGDGARTLHEQMLEYLAVHSKIKLAFNPGTHQIHLGLDELKPVLKRSEIVFLNREETAEVLELRTLAIPLLVKGLHDLGVKVAVLTDGPKGSYVSDGSSIWFSDIFDGPVIERTGCGDAYGSGFLSAIVKGRSIQEAMAWGNANSTSVVQYIGAREGLLTEDTLEQMIRENKHVQVEEYHA